MKIIEITETAKSVWTRSKGKNVRKYRCTAGSRKGQVVAKPATCTAPKNMSSSRAIKTSSARRGQTRRIKSTQTKKTNAASSRLKSLNKRRRAKPKRRKSRNR